MFFLHFLLSISFDEWRWMYNLHWGKRLHANENIIARRNVRAGRVGILRHIIRLRRKQASNDQFISK